VWKSPTCTAAFRVNLIALVGQLIICEQVWHNRDQQDWDHAAACFLLQSAQRRLGRLAYSFVSHWWQILLTSIGGKLVVTPHKYYS
jgi:hypothetical protein